MMSQVTATFPSSMRRASQHLGSVPALLWPYQKSNIGNVGDSLDYTAIELARIMCHQLLERKSLANKCAPPL